MSMLQTKALEEIIKELPFDTREELKHYALFLWEKMTFKKRRSKTGADLYKTIVWGKTDQRKQKRSLKKLSGIFSSKEPSHVSEDIDSHLYS